MQTVFLTNPISTLSRPVGPTTGVSAGEVPADHAFDLSAGLADGPPESGQIEALSLPIALKLEEGGNFAVNPEPVGVVQGLSEAESLLGLSGNDDTPRPELSILIAPLPVSMSSNLIGKIATPSVESNATKGVAAEPFLMSPQPSQDASQTTTDDKTPSGAFTAQQGQEQKDFAVVDLPKLSSIGSNTKSDVKPPFSGDPAGLPIADPQFQRSNPASASELPPPVARPVLDFSDRLKSPVDQGLKRMGLPQVQTVAPNIRELANPALNEKALAPPLPKPDLSDRTAVASSLVGVAAFLPSDFHAETGQGEPDGPGLQVGSGLSGSLAHIRLAAYPPPDGQMALALRWGGDFFPAQNIFAMTGDPGKDVATEATTGLGSVPANGTVIAGSVPASTVVGLQDLPRLAAQLAGTLVHRADGQVEIALSPEELGHVRLSMQADVQNPDRMVVMLTFEKPETLDLFRRYADQLADALRDAGYSGSDISFGWSGGEAAKDDTNPDNPALARADPQPSGRNPDDFSSPQPSRSTSTRSLDLRL